MSGTVEHPTHRRRFASASRIGGRLHQLCIVGIAFVWLIVGTLKLFDPDEWRRAIVGHGILGAAAPWIATTLPCYEILLGLGVAFAYPLGGSIPVLGRAAVAASLFTLVSFTAYVMLVPAQKLVVLGCGCLGAGLTNAAHEHVASMRAEVLLRNGVLALLHVPVFTAQLCERRRSRSIRTGQ